jgi:PPP family 3-phenylpropionic acid transporter
MAARLGGNAGDGFAWRLALFYAGMFAAMGVQLPFFPAWLQARGLDPGAIGVVLAAPMVVRVVAVPPITRLADRLGAVRGVLIATSLAAAAGYLWVALAEGFGGILIAVACASIAATPVLPIADAYALQGLGFRSRPYGPVRLWGSVAFIVASFAAGLAARHMPPTGFAWLIVAALAVSAAVTFALRPTGVAPLASSAATRRSRLPSAAVLGVMIGASLIQASHAVYYGFATLDWTQRGLGGPQIGALWGLGVAAEVALFAASGRVPMAAGRLIAVGALGAVVRWGAMTFAPPDPLLPLLQCLHGLSFGATHLGTVQFLARTGEGRAAVQGDFATTLGLVMAAVTGLSGLIYASFGTHAYAAMALCAALGGGLALIAAARRG